MTVRNTVGRLLGRERGDEPERDPPQPSHECQSCGETYYTDPEMEIRTCRECGGIKVEQV